MKTTALKALVYRSLSLRYYRTALSPKGARTAAGRFNRVGTAVVYLALEPETGLAEYYGAAPTPVVVIPAQLDASGLVDLRGGTSSWSKDW